MNTYNSIFKYNSIIFEDTLRVCFLTSFSNYFRVALDDRLDQRDLEVALALSVNESSSVSSHKIQDLEEQGDP